MKTIRRANERGHANHGWLETYHTFSFARYYDPQWMGYRSLRVINDDKVAPGKGFGTHPHENMEIITYILEGELEHKDSMGNGRIIRTGEVQYMAAGTGVQHSEFNPSSNKPVHLLQIWIQPDEQNVTPRYAEQSFADAEANIWHLIASKEGRENSISIHQDADLWMAHLDPGGQLKHGIASGRGTWLHLAMGSIEANGETLASGDALAIEDTESIEIKGNERSTLLLFNLA